jgi:hypothetical protein
MFIKIIYPLENDPCSVSAFIDEAAKKMGFNILADLQMLGLETSILLQD